MCDFQKRKVLDYHTDRKKMRFMKKSRWELPIPKSTSYWNEICNNMEKNVRKVRDPFFHFPYISHTNDNLDFDPHDSAEFINLSKVQSYDEPIVKISPPTPLRKSSFKSTTDVHQDKNTFDKKYANLDENLILRFRSLLETRKKNVTSECASFDKTEFPKAKMYSKKICPYHESELPTSIFSDNLKHLLPRKNFHAEELFDKNLVNQKLEKTDSKYSDLQSSDSKKVDEVFETCKSHENAASLEQIASKVEYEIEKKPFSDTQNTKRTPKLGKASLLASFSKTISIPSSTETHESSDEDYSKSKKELTSSQSVSKDYLRVPKLGYASLHPSFRKIVPTDSFPDQEEIINYPIPKTVSEYSFDFQSDDKLVDPEILKTPSLLENSSDEKPVSSLNIERAVDSKLSHDRKKGESKSVKLLKKQNYSTRYIYRALKLVTKNQNLKFGQERVKSIRGSSKSSSSSSSKSGYKIRTNRKSIIDTSTYRNIRNKLRRVAPKYLGQDDHFSSKESEPKIKTIISTTRSTSGASPAFQIPRLKFKILTRIPSIKMYPRKNADRCLPCLIKSFKIPEKMKRELPKAILSSVVKEPFKNISESDTSSVSLPDLKSPDFESILSERGYNLKSNLEPRLESSKSETTLKEDDKVSRFPDNDSILSREQSLSAKSTDLRKVSVKSGSVHSTDLSKPSSPSGQSLESEDARPEVTNDSLNTSKYLAPCHAPVVWIPSLESLKALRLRKAISMQSRASAVTSKSEDDSDLEDSLIEIASPQEARKRHRKAPSKSVTIRSPDLIMKSNKEDSESKPDLDESLKDKRKALTRIKTISGQIGTSALKLDEEKKTRFVRAQTSLDLSSRHSGARKMSFFDIRNSAADSMIFKEELLIREDLTDKEIWDELSKDEKEVLEILESCVEEGESPREILKKLCDWYSKRVSEVRKGDIDPNLKKALKTSIKLLRLLAESKRYLNADNLSPDLEFSSKQPPLCNSRQLRRVLPLKSYNLVAPILNMPQWHPKIPVKTNIIFANDKNFEKAIMNRRRYSELDSDLFVHPSSITEPFLLKHTPDTRGLNPYALFLVKPRRKVVTWRPLEKKDLQGYNPDATLHMRASKITDKICHDFCEWLRGLSGSLERIDEEVLKDMFQIIFTADACKSMQVLIKELPTVPKPIALVRNCPSDTELERTRKELIRDIKAGKKPKKTFAFGSTLPKNLRFVPPQNQVEKKWLLCENVPQELESMDAVWNGIKHLESVKGFVSWLKNNTSLAPPHTLDITTVASVSRFSQEDMITQVDFEEKEFY